MRVKGGRITIKLSYKAKFHTLQYSKLLRSGSICLRVPTRLSHFEWKKKNQRWEIHEAALYKHKNLIKKGTKWIIDVVSNWGVWGFISAVKPTRFTPWAVYNLWCNETTLFDELTLVDGCLQRNHVFFCLIENDYHLVDSQQISKIGYSDCNYAPNWVSDVSLSEFLRYNFIHAKALSRHTCIVSF